ncbi:MAG: zinc-binding dehydrogenase [Christensenellaceae bacterium]|nr:zinc-binding dehydrogenase [Christensenellaceae bacterium]
MKGLVVDAQGKLSVEELSIPTYNDCQALVRMLSCGVCNGTDMKIIHGTFKNFDTYPAVLGHEGVGEVVEVGSKVTSYKKGDIVLLPFLEGNPDGYASGWGAYSEYCVVGDKEACIKNGMGPGTPEFSEGYYAQTVVNDVCDPVAAAMIITFREVLSAMKRFQMEPNKSIVIFGAGPVGLCFTRFAKLLGLAPVITIDITDEKAAEAERLGADIVFNSTKVDVDSEIKKILPEGADFVVDAVGINALINQAMGLVKYNGKICCYGISPKLGMNLDWSRAPYNWTLQFVQFPLKLEEAEAHTQIAAWIKAGVLNPYDFISDVIPFSDILGAFEKVAAGQAQKKIVIKF